MYCMWLRAAGDAEVANPGDPAELHVDYLNPPFPATLAYDIRQIVDYLTAPDGVPSGVSKCCADLSRTRVCDGVIQVRHFQKGAPKVRNAPRNDRIEAYRVAVFGGGSQPGEVLGARCYMLVEYRIDMKGDYPVESRLEFTFESAKPNEQSFFKRVEDDERHKRLEARLDDLPETVEHLPISLYYPWG